MSYLKPAEFVVAMVDSGESKVLMATRDAPHPGLYGRRHPRPSPPSSP